MLNLSPGQALGERFVLLRRIAEGGTSEVWLAEDRELERRVALKVLDPGLLAGKGELARLKAELGHLAKLDPGEAVDVLGLHEVDGLTLIEMEYLSGGDLGQYRGRSFAVFGPILVELAGKLASAHERGLVHRDLKGSNVLLDAAGRPRLADFGLATLAGTVATGGSPYNMSPQQLRGDPASPGDDLYAFGAMLYELLSGHPPFYPDITRDRVLHEPLPPLIPRAAAPERARQLALRLLSKSPSARPADMKAVQQELTLALAEPEDDAAARPVVAAPQPPGGASGQPGTPRRLGRGMLLAIAATVAAGLVFVFAWLPGQVAERAAVDGQAATAAALADAERARQQQQQGEAREQARVAALAARDAFAARLASLEAQAAAVWATAELAAARAAADAATRQFDVGDFAPARDSWTAATASLDAIEASRPAALQAALADGETAIARGNAQAAARAFELALVIEPGNPAAQRGLERTTKLDEVFALLDQAAREEQANRSDAALAGYRKALALDAQAPGASEAVTRITARQADEAFAAVMSRGMAAMSAGRMEEAGAALRQAQGMRPGSRQVQDALDELARTRKATGLQGLTDRALAAERTEDWEAARGAWSEALEMEPTLATARAGVERSAPRAQLDARIDGLIRQPEKLWTPAGQADAEGALANAADAADPKADLARRAAQLEALLQAARTPVSLQLQSDGLTDVVIYRVGRMGAFERRDVELLPGRYAIVGTRPGYRDVRREVEIPPGSPPDPVVVKCEEPI